MQNVSRLRISRVRLLLTAATSDLHILLWNPATMLHKAHVPPPAQRTWQFSAKQIVMAFRSELEAVQSTFN